MTYKNGRLTFNQSIIMCMNFDVDEIHLTITILFKYHRMEYFSQMYCIKSYNPILFSRKC
jgi:hypothetical protein